MTSFLSSRCNLGSQLKFQLTTSALVLFQLEKRVRLSYHSLLLTKSYRFNATFIQCGVTYCSINRVNNELNQDVLIRGSFSFEGRNLPVCHLKKIHGSKCLDQGAHPEGAQGGKCPPRISVAPPQHMSPLTIPLLPCQGHMYRLNPVDSIHCYTLLMLQ